MSGHISAVQLRMKEMVPRLIYTDCVAHVFELAMLDSMKFADSYLEKFKTIIWTEYSSFIISPLWDDKNWNECGNVSKGF